MHMLICAIQILIIITWIAQEAFMKGYINIFVDVFSTHLLHCACSPGIWPAASIVLVLANCYCNTWNNLKFVHNLSRRMFESKICPECDKTHTMSCYVNVISSLICIVISQEQSLKKTESLDHFSVFFWQKTSVLVILHHDLQLFTRKTRVYNQLYFVLK